MTFDSLTFVAFFGLVALLFHALPWSWSARKNWLLLASAVFYAAWNPPFLLLLIGSATVDWWLAAQMAQAPSSRRKPWLVVSLLANLGLLGWFKYGDFLRDNARWLLAQAGIDWQPAAFDVLLPVGISFYTFQSLSYCIDVYRGEVRPQRSLRDYLLFVAFFPQLVAGPIVRYRDFAAQLHAPRATTARDYLIGMSLLLLGLALKIVLADTVFAPVADPVFGAQGATGFNPAFAATLAFAGQIFCDFGGYSLCAIGCAALLGFRLPDNFLSPYAAVGFSDFWRRWHVSLSSWLRDYLYVPLGGNRGGGIATARNLMLTMLIGGLWHGAAWTYVAWGGFHGLMLMLERALKPATSAAARLLGGLAPWLGGSITLGSVLWAWVWFRAPDFATATRIHDDLLGRSGWGSALSSEAHIAITCFLALVTLQVAMRRTDLRQWILRRGSLSLALLWASLLVAIVLSPGASRAFIYFQF